MSDWNDVDDPFDVLNDLPEGLRSNIPEIQLRIQGNETYLMNFNMIMKKLKREEHHVTRFLSKELGMKSKVSGEQLVLSGMVTKKHVTGILEEYVNKFIICPFCGKPDTLLHGKKKNIKLECAACGTISQI